MDGIRTVEEIEQEAQQLIEILERQWELMDAYEDKLITEQELEDGLLLLSLIRAPTPDPLPKLGEGK